MMSKIGQPSTTLQTPSISAGDGQKVVRAGFIPLVDASVLIAAAEFGFAAREGLTLDLVKGASLAAPRWSTPGPVTRHLDGAGYEATTGIGPDLMTAAREAVMRMVDLLGAEHGLAPVDAYMLCSVCADLRISEIVDQPNWVVSFLFPRIVFA